MRKNTVAILLIAVLTVAVFVAGCSEAALESMEASDAATSTEPSASTETSESASAEAVPSAEASASAEISASAEASAAVSEEPTEMSTATATSDIAGSESATADAQASGDVGTLPTADPMFATVSVLGSLVAVDAEQDIFTIQESLPDGTDAETQANGEGQIAAVEADDCVIIDSQTGAEVDDDQLRVGDRVFAFVSPNQTRSIPPQAACYALITNIPENGLGIASYVHAIDVQSTSNGDIQVLNQNADLWVTIPADLTIEVFDEPGQTATAAQIRPGSNLIVWYDMVAESYPAQTTATRVMIDLDD